MPDFYPPKLSPPLVWAVQRVSPLIAQYRYKMRLEVQPSDLETLRTLQPHRLLLLANHPTHYDWIALFLLSARWGQPFHYLAAYERFGGAAGWFLQRMGAYSLRRGLGDRPSMSKTLELLSQPRCRLVMFPEGGFSFQNDTVMPFRTGAVQLAMQAMQRQLKQGTPAEALDDLYVVPIALKYRYQGDMAPAIEQTLKQLEKALWVFPSSPDWYERLLVIGEQVLLGFERDYGLPIAETVQRSRDDRIQQVKDHILNYCERTLKISPNFQEPLRERVYRIQRSLEAQAGTLDLRTHEAIARAAAQLLNFNAISDGYVAANPTPERFLDTLTRLERAVFGIDRPPPKGDRTVILRVGEPVNLTQYLDDYIQDRTQTVEQLTEKLRSTVQTNLDLM
ncbi:1-acyl-sn-glycerol-3-phosphate acyltransferase [Leptolyngbya sp. O-77]|uniref:1-acyl-sn-glycerol-3-phosphate acyltransferase n=1 Tax=Leptolyngbya sp. O-77 TaxID=1080068 RepID=UPI00074D2F38|nr:1-acyl-sn-glycerol-3-phosphate acyltransferase [Leptolyngbya sp. O-77]BAU43704.1 Acyltransferase [Leptolyngbya sp. O-77]